MASPTPVELPTGPGPLGVPLQALELMAKGDVLKGELAMRSKRSQEEQQDAFEHNRGYRPNALSRYLSARTEYLVGIGSGKRGSGI